MSNRVFVTLATIMGFSLILGLAVLVIVTRTADELPPPSPTVIIVTPLPVTCVFTWARQDLPDTAAVLQAVLETGTVRVEAYGENCNDSQTMQFRYFAAMTTDFYFTVPVRVLDDDVLAELVQVLYTHALTIPRSELPAPPGYLDIVFTLPSTTRHLRTRFAEIESALDANKRGAALLDALGGLM